MTSREVALDVLLAVERGGAYSNLQLNQALQKSGLTRADAGLATELVYGTIQRLNTIDYRLASFVSKKLNRLEPWVLVLLRLSAYQLIYLDRVPVHAVVNEAVSLVHKRGGHQGIVGFVNGVLRAMGRSLEQVRAGSKDEHNLPIAERISLIHSFPLWMVERFIAAYGPVEAEKLCKASNSPPRMSVRVQALKANREQVLNRLLLEGIEADPSPLCASGIVAKAGSGNLALHVGYMQGLWTVQDESSMLVAQVCNPQPGQRVLDCCSAPGGKSTHLAELMGDVGEVIANDLHEHKAALIENQAKRLGLTIVKAVTSDAAELSSQYLKESMDVVLLDAPCSGLGVIRRKPEMKWNKSLDDIHELKRLQRRLLAEVSQLVKPGGTLVYSTCTIAPEENEEQVRHFLVQHPEFELDVQWGDALIDALSIDAESFQGMLQLLPHHYGSDGFFIAKLRRK